MKFDVEVTVTNIYLVVVEAEDEAAAEEKALEMEYSDMQEVSATVEVFAQETEIPNEGLPV